MKRPDLYVSMAPHIHAGYSTRQMMYESILALIPVVFAGWFFFGWAALTIVLVCAATAVITEGVWQKAIGRPVRIADGSALLTGILLGLVLSPELPWWMAALGAIVAILVGKNFFGGLGQHPFNSVLVGWAFIFVSYQSAMIYYSMPEPRWWLEPGGYIEYPPLDALRLDGIYAVAGLPWSDFFYGNVPGAIGTTSVLAVLLGGIYLIARRIISWHIPVFFILSAWLFASIFWLIDPETYANPNLHILIGWIFLGAFFLAPEKGTTPITARGMIFYGIGCGVLTMTFRIWGTFILGVPFAIILMNTLTPILDRIRPRAVGRVREVA
jgi:Na+-translocating ferredoxin:NAD+ oxidoreductase subunit D